MSLFKQEGVFILKMDKAMYTILFGILGIIVPIVLWLIDPMDFKPLVKDFFKNIFAREGNVDLNIGLEKKGSIIENKELIMDKKQEDNLMANKNNKKMLYKLFLITAIVLAIVSIIYYTTPWIKNLITDEIIEGPEKIEEDTHSLRIEDTIEDKETISLEPRILVFVTEMHAGKEVSDNSTEIAIINGLLKAGFVVINKHGRDSIGQNPLIKKILKEDKQATLELATQYGANVVIDGKAISEKTGMVSDFHSVRAYLEIRAYNTDEDKVIAAHSLQISRAGITEDSAYKTAFNLAGEQMADYLVERLAEFRNPEEIRNINLFIDNFRNKSQFEKLKEAISKMLLVIEVRVNLLESEKAELIVKTLGDVQELIEDLSNLTFINLEIKKVNDNLVQITVR